jgi:ATP-dependent RNA helicase DDX60
MLFRCGYLRIVLATETLAFGINMPCRTVVFAGDNVALNSIQYQQMSGRAGRRGLDVLGHVVFFDVPRHKMHRLIVAPVPRLCGHFLHSPTFLIRLLSLDSQIASQRGANPVLIERVRNAVKTALNHSLYDTDLKISTSVRAIQIKHVFNLFLRSGLVDSNVSPRGLISLASHFHAMEPSNLALIALLQAGALHRLCEKPEGQGWDFTRQPALWRGSVSDWESTARDLLVVLSHLFCRERLHSSLAMEVSRTPRRGVVILPQLPECCASVLNRYHRSNLLNLSAAAAAVASKIPATSEVSLPYSKLSFRSSFPDSESRSIPGGIHVAASSISVHNPFSCLSGDADAAGSCQELLASAREDMALHDALLPLPLLPGPPLSAYVLDFFTHEQLDLVCRECGMCSAVAWQGLRQFQLILASLHKAVAAYAPPTDNLLACIGRLEAEYSGKFYAKLYR